ncbi:MAG: LamB/YcsF family protein [Deltaproteobacteria bacterium]|nr:LamB/YcsF family protein [Deltaproteobacteria bacterium]MBW1993953.1 LamB/YcsF family protein [Deltaproteobacteria bacterium]MBW2153047.1 LamB/YcsF family protein [Deltaproteobacteria bacterium]
MKKIDLNSDMGESFGKYKLGNDEEIMKYITSANIACGFHAGDPHVLKYTIQLAKETNTAVGAHPGLPDLIGFGRRAMDVTPEELYDYCVYQIGAAQAFCAALDVSLQHVKCHGILESMTTERPELAEAIAAAVKDVDPNLLYMTIAGTRLYQTCKEAGLRVAGEAYGDRAYNEDGTLVSRKLPGSVITDAKVVVERIMQFLETGSMPTYQGGTVKVDAQSICMHGDTPGAATMIKALREQLDANEIEVVPVGTLV